MENLIYKKIPVIMWKIGVIGKDRTNKIQNYQFRWIDDMYNALNQHLAEEKVFFTSEILSTQREERESKNGGTLIYSVITMKFTAYAEDGSSVSSTTVGESMDSWDKSMNKAMSTAYKKQTVDTPTGWTKPKAMASKDETCPSCWIVNKEVKKGTTKDGRDYEKCDCECWTSFFINRK